MKNQKVRKAIIPAAGLGTRFLPATKALAKEMLPIVDKPTIQFIVEEALKSGIEDILVVTGKSKRSIEDHFDSNFELEYNLEQKGKTDLLKLVNDTTAINLHFIRQSHPRGLGDAVLQAKAFVGNEPFVVMLGDDLMDITNDKAVPLTKQLINDYEETHASTIAVMPVPHEEVSSYGVIAPQGKGENGRYSVETFVEKPNPEDAIDILSKVGGFEIGGMAGVILGCSANRIPVVLDGFISYAAALLAYKINPKTREYMIASHSSAEPGTQRALKILNLEPVLNMGMRLGEGSGAALAFNIIEAANYTYENMATFDEVDMGR